MDEVRQQQVDQNWRRFSGPILKAYPQISAYDVIRDADLLKRTGGAQAVFDTIKKQIVISDSLNLQSRDALDYIAHELQHAIQDIEGFAPGTSLFGALYGLGAAKHRVKVLSEKSSRTPVEERELKFLRDELRQSERFRYNKKSVADYYHHASGEVEARIAEARRGMTAEQRAATPPWMSLDYGLGNFNQQYDSSILQWDDLGANRVRESRRRNVYNDMPTPEEQRQIAEFDRTHPSLYGAGRILLSKGETARIYAQLRDNNLFGKDRHGDRRDLFDAYIYNPDPEKGIGTTTVYACEYLGDHQFKPYSRKVLSGEASEVEIADAYEQIREDFAGRNGEAEHRHEDGGDSLGVDGGQSGGGGGNDTLAPRNGLGNEASRIRGNDQGTRQVSDAGHDATADAGVATAVSQRLTSARTSLPSNDPALYKSKWFTDALRPGAENFDIGAGITTKPTERLAALGVTNVPFDPFNRDQAANASAIRSVADGRRFPTVTVANVLNVIAEPESRSNVILQAAKALATDGKAFFDVYTAPREGETKTGTYQTAMKPEEYVPELERWFGRVERHGSILIASEPKPEVADTKASWWDANPASGGNTAMFSGARSAAAIFGGHVRVRPDGRMDYSMVKDSLVARTRMIQGSPAFQFPSQRRRLAQIAADPQRSVPRLP